MFRELTTIIIAVVYLQHRYVSTTEIEKFYIKPETEIPRTTDGENRVNFDFPDKLEYMVRYSGGEFTKILYKCDDHVEPIQTTQIKNMFLVLPEHHNKRQMAIYTDHEEKTIVAVRCEPMKSACVLTGYLYKSDKTWSIRPMYGELNIYQATIADDSKVCVDDVIHEGRQWIEQDTSWIEQRRTSAEKRQNTRSRRDARTKRDVDTVCNILEVRVVADASVWHFFLARNNNNAAMADADLRQRYAALIREVDLIYSCLPVDICLRVYLVDVVIQMDNSTDWTNLTASGNVDALAGLFTCGDLLAGDPWDPDAVLCFSRIQFEGNGQTEGVFGAVNTGSACNPGLATSGVFEDFYNGLPRLVALAISLQIDVGIFNCNASLNVFNVDDLTFSLPSTVDDFSSTFMFSECAQDILRDRLEELTNMSNNCLMSGNITDAQFELFANKSALAGELVAKDHQCQIIYGVDSMFCEQVNTTSNQTIETGGLCGPGIYCTVNGNCDSRAIALSGTHCGFNKICNKGVCIDVPDCGAPPMVPKGYYFLTSGDVDQKDVATLICFHGYETQSTVTITCRSKGWSHGSEMCKAKDDCGFPPHIENGYYKLNGNDTFVNSTADIVCCKGFFKPMTTTITCTAEGWVGVENCTDSPCPNSSWVQAGSSCYLFDANDRFFNESVNFCETVPGAFIVVIEDEAEGNFLKKYAAKIARPEPLFTGYWIGAIQNGTNGALIWQPTGEEVTFFDWFPGQPDDRNFMGMVSQQSCTQIWRNFSYCWADIECDVGVPGEGDIRKGFVVCELPLEGVQVCEDLPDIANGSYLQTHGSTFGSIAYLHCDAGFSPSSEFTSIVCKSDCTYSEPEAICIPDCGMPPHIENGYYKLDGDDTLINATADIYCCKGFFKPMTTTITCTAEGWVGVENCTDNPCPNSSWVQAGSSCYLFDANDRFFNESVNFCETVPGAFIVVIEDEAEGNFLKKYAAKIARPEPLFTGYWIGAIQNGTNGALIWQPTGEEVTFFDWFPGQPDDRNFTGMVSQQSCTQIWRNFSYCWADIECDVGVPGEGDIRKGFVVCELPLEGVQVCEDLPDIANGSYLQTHGNTFGSVAYLHCDAGFSPSTEFTSIVCKSDCTYSQPEAICISDCGMPPHIDNGYYKLDDNDTLINATADIVCCKGFFKPMITTITCTAEGWVGVENCTDSPCPNSSWVQAGSSCYLFDANERFFNESVNFCETVPGAFIVVIEDEAEGNFLKKYAAKIARPEPLFTGYWIGAIQNGTDGALIWQPTGEEVTFFDWFPGQPDDRNFTGMVSQQSCTQIWRNFSYCWADIECDVGVPGEGDIRKGFVVCELPLEGVQVCEDLPDIANGSYLQTHGNTFGSVAYLHCDAGFSPSTEFTSIVCKSDCTYSQPEAICIPDCGMPPHIDNGYYKLDGNDTLINATADIVCCKGFFKPITTTITCTAEGWVGVENCTDSPCPNSSWVQAGSSCYLFDANERFFNESVNFCETVPGAFIVVIEDEAEGNFLKKYAAKIARPEPLFTGYWIGAVQNGTNGALIWQPTGEEVTFFDWFPGQPDDRNFTGIVSQQSCTQIWRNFSYCWADIECDIGVPGEGDIRKGFVVCELPLEGVQVCDDLPDVANGSYLQTRGNTFGSIAYLHCEEGFGPSSEFTAIVCQSDCTYSEPEAICITDCGEPPETDWGFYQLDNGTTLLNATAKLFCCNGSFTQLDSRITCTEDGWSEPTSNCSADPCPNATWVREEFSCYLFDPNERFYSESRAFCESFPGATLVIVEDMTERDFLKTYANMTARPEPLDTGYWIAAVQDGVNGTLIWEPTGEVVTFFDWFPGQPDDRNFTGMVSQQSCTQMWRNFSYCWADIECDVGVPGEGDIRKGFSLCEFRLDPHIV